MNISYKTADFTKFADQDLLKGIDYINKGEYKRALDLFEKVISTGDNEYASLFAGCIHFMGFGINRDIYKASLHFIKAAKFHSRVAQYLLGMINLNEDLSYVNGIRWLNLSADNGYSMAQEALALYYHLGIGVVEKDWNKAIHWYTKVTNAEDDDKFYLFGNKNLEMKFDNVNQEYLSASAKICIGEQICFVNYISDAYNNKQYPSWKPMAKTLFWYYMSRPLANVTLCQSNLSLISNDLSHNDSTPQDEAVINKSKFNYWTMKAAEEGSSHAQYLAGLNYETARRDYSKAMEWYQKAADQGDIDALYSIGMLYYLGLGVERNIVTSKSYFMNVMARTDNHGGTHYALGNMYDNVGQNSKEARKFYANAVNLGIGLGATEMGKLYLEGRPDLKRDVKTALNWLSKSDTMDCPVGQYILGCMYLKGQDVNTDIDRAMELFKKSLGGGFKTAAKGISVVNDIKSRTFAHT